jgi:vacuolar-type H+-ATPase subunit I/STV1
MEWLDQIWQQFVQYISIPYLLTFMLLSYLVKKYFSDWLGRITNMKWRTVYTVLILATIVAIPFLFFTGETIAQVLFSYALGTSLHELCFKWIEEKFINK